MTTCFRLRLLPIAILGTEIASVGAAPAAEASDPQLIWTVASAAEHYTIRRSAPDGSQIVDFADGIIIDSLGGLAVDASARTLYWIEIGPTERRIVRGDLDGGGRKVLLRTTDSLSRIALDSGAGMIYFTTLFFPGGAGIKRISTEGGTATGVIEREVDDLAVDGAGGMVYWVQQGEPGEYGTNIWRAALDGTGPERIIHHEFEHHTTGITLDVPQGKIYWGTVDYRDTHAQIVKRANLDGSAVEPVTTANPGLDDWPVFLGIDQVERKLYFVNGEDHEFFRVSLEGGQAESLFENADVYGPFGFAVLSSEAKPPQFRRGDADGDGTIALTDPIVTLGALFLGESPPGCEDAADVNDDGSVDLSDAVAALAYLFLGSFDIPLPGPVQCGSDPEPPSDGLGCGAYPSCAP